MEIKRVKSTWMAVGSNGKVYYKAKNKAAVQKKLDKYNAHMEAYRKIEKEKGTPEDWKIFRSWKGWKH